jgi:predicted DCC family thiol-disulfide oxidoreductase YuxK
MSNSKIILFDGVCNLCNGFVQLVIKNDAHQQFKFGSLQSKNVQPLLQKHNVSPNLKTVVFIDGSKVYFKSDAALNIIKYLKFPFNLLFFFKIVPTFLRNFFYDFIAKYRYRYFGKKDTCMLPTAELKHLFIDAD